MTVKKFFLFISIICLYGCSTIPSRNAETVLESNQSQVMGCLEIGQVSGWSGYGGLLAQDIGLKRAQNEAREKASDLHASHLVWSKLSKGFWGANVEGFAYICKP